MSANDAPTLYEDLRIQQGCDWTSATYVYLDQATGLPVDLTGYTFAMKVRTSPIGAGTGVGTVLLSLTGGAGITGGGAGGTVIVAVTHTQSLAIARGEYFYDLLMTSAGGVVTKLLGGLFIVEATVTQ